MLNVGRTLALAVIASTFPMCIALGGVLSAHGAIQRSSSHTPGDGGLSAFAINPQNAQIVYAGSATGVYKSTDAGRRWRVMNSGLDPYVAALAIDQRNPDVLYAGTASYTAGTPSGVFKSMNAGRTWRRMRSTVSDNDVVALALHPRNSRVVYAGTDDGVYKSSNAGASWRKVTTHPHAVRVFAIALDPQRPATVYAGSGGGVFKSTDAGRSWQKRNNGLFPETGTPTVQDLAEGYVAAMVVNPRDPRTLYLGCENGVFKSTDGARTWRAVNSGLRARNGIYRYAQSLAIDPNDPQTLYAGTALSGLVKTTNGGRRWNAVRLPIDLPDAGSVLALALEPTNSKTVYVGMSSGGKAFKSMDGGRTWRALSILW